LGKSFKLGSTVLNPTLIIKSAKNAPATADLGINFLFREKCWAGLSFRSAYGTLFLLQYHINEKLKLGYSYDFGRNKIGRAGEGSHEVMIGYDLNMSSPKIAMPRYL
jgi:Type IX secretion system membrane protein PorP/SprF